MNTVTNTRTKKNWAVLNVAKHDLGKVRLEPMQSAVSPLAVRDL